MSARMLLDEDTGSAYRVELWQGRYCLQVAPLNADGTLPVSEDDWADVDFGRGLDEDDAIRCRVIERGLSAIESAL
jgi:hypothetical protein